MDLSAVLVAYCKSVWDMQMDNYVFELDLEIIIINETLYFTTTGPPLRKSLVSNWIHLTNTVIWILDDQAYKILVCPDTDGIPQQ